VKADQEQHHLDSQTPKLCLPSFKAIMEQASAAQYSRSLRKQLADAGLQGALQADAFKMLLQYMTEAQADQQIMAIILEQLKECESRA
jgi:hypothetical protein